MNLISNFNYVAIAVIGGVRVASGQMSLGDVVAFIQYSRQFTQPIVQAASIANVLQSAVASAERVFELLDEAELGVAAGGTAGVWARWPAGWSSRTCPSAIAPEKPLIEHLSLVADAGRARSPSWARPAPARRPS